MKNNKFKLSVDCPNGWQIWDNKSSHMQTRPPKNKWCLFMEIMGEPRTGEIFDCSYYVGKSTDTDKFIFSDGKTIDKKDLFNSGDLEKVIMFNEWACPNVLDIAEMEFIKH